MNIIIQWLEGVFNSIPLSLLEGWGLFAYAIGFGLMLAAFGGFTFRPGGSWGLGRERQTWDTRALLSIVLTFVLVISTGYIGSFIVLVPGAQTFESLKDLSVFLCILLFGYPALLAVPFAYGISDLAEGVPPDFLWGWIFGYFINPACFWVAFQLIGKNPDFRLLRTWGWYLVFVAIFMSLEPQLWGYICSGKFTAEISYRNITPALFFTTSVTWLLAPFAMLMAFPLAKKLRLFWAEIPGHVKERPLGRKEWVWQSGQSYTQSDANAGGQGMPIRMFLAAPLVALVLILVISVAFLTLRSGEKGANTLAGRLHQETSMNIDLQVDDYLEKVQGATDHASLQAIDNVLRNSSIAKNGRAFLIDHSGQLVASSSGSNQVGENVPRTAAVNSKDHIVQGAARALQKTVDALGNLKGATQFRFDIVTAKPLSRETWLAQATPYQDRSGHINWIGVTAMPESAYLGEVRAGNRQSAIVLAVALTASLLIAVLLAGVMAAPLRRMSRSAQALAAGDLAQRVGNSKLEELDALARYFNEMAVKLQQTMENLEAEVGEQTRMKEALRHLSDRLQLATRAANIGIWDWDVVTDELIWDDAMYRVYGIHKEDFSGAYDAWSTSLHPDDREHATRELQAALEGKCDFNTEFRIVWPGDRSVHNIKAMAQAIRAADGKALRMIGVNFDVTDSHLAEEELRRHRDHLEELVRERTTELTVARDQADAANLAKSAFLSNMSHEIRTPMNAIMGYTQLMQRMQGLPPAAVSYVSVIERSSAHLMALINDVLEMSKIEAGRTVLQISDFSFSGLVGDVESMLRERAMEKNISMTLDIDKRIPDAMCSDATKLQQILLNIIGNAVKFTEHGSIAVRARLHGESGHGFIVAVDVTDTGPGINPSDLPKVFELFEQTSSGRDKGGTGLGMPISLRYARMMGGDIAIESTPGAGTTVHFTFAAKAAVNKVGPIRSGIAKGIIGLAGDSAVPRILIVDDIPSNRDILRLMLENVGLTQTREAADGAQAMELVRAWQPSLVLMDRHMPGMDGLQATRLIRGLSDGAAIRIIIVSASALDMERQDAFASGADGFVSKPFRQEKILEEIQRLCPQVVFNYGSIVPSQTGKSAAADHGIEAAAIHAELAAQLIDLIECGDVARFEKLVAEQLTDSAPSLCDHLLKLAEKFDYSRILHILRREE